MTLRYTLPAPKLVTAKRPRAEGPLSCESPMYIDQPLWKCWCVHRPQQELTGGELRNTCWFSRLEMLHSSLATGSTTALNVFWVQRYQTTCVFNKLCRFVSWWVTSWISMNCKGRIFAVKNFLHVICTRCTLPETNMAPENRPLEKEIRIGNHHF